MISSMTGFAAASHESALGHLGVEVRTVTHRYLEFQTRMPEELRSLEPAMRAFADHPEWELGDVLSQWRAAVTDDVAAGRALRKLVGSPKPTLPPWRIVDAAPHTMAANVLAKPEKPQRVVVIVMAGLAVSDLELPSTATRQDCVHRARGFRCGARFR